MIPLPYRILAIVSLWLASLVAVGWWQRGDGATTTQAKWQARELAQQARATNAIRAMQDAARLAEQKSAAALAAVATDYERKLTDANKQRSADLAAVRTGALRLRDPGSPVSACAGSAAKTGTATGIGNGGPPGKLQEADVGLLSGQASEFLIDFAADADQVADQLAACQRVVMKDRE